MNLSAVPRITDGVTTWSGASLNPIIDALEKNITQLANTVDMLTGDSGYIFTDTGFSDECEKGMLVAYDTTLDRYIPAAAVWSEDRAPNGGLIAADSAFVVGLLMTDVDKNRNGVIMAAGWTMNKEIIEKAAPEGTPGRYYLSVGGKATLLSGGNSSILPVYCFSLTATGKLILSPQKPDVSNHAHTALELQAKNWKEKSSINGEFDGPAEESEGGKQAEYVYDVKADKNLQDLLQSYTSGHSLVYNGKALAESEWGVTEKGYLYMTSSGSTDATSTFYTETPFFGVEPLIRAIGITTGNDILKATALAGTVMLDCEFPNKGQENSAIAVTAVDRTGVKTTPVVSTLEAGPGIVVSTLSKDGKLVPGGYTISSASVVGTLLDMIMVNANGVGLGGGPNSASIVYPAGATASALFAFRVPVTGTAMSGRLEACVFGTGKSINSFSAKVSILKMPTAETPTEKPIAQEVTLPQFAPDAEDVSIDQIATTETGKVYLLQSASFNGLESNAMVYFELTATSPSDSIAVAAAGVRLLMPEVTEEEEEESE